MARELQDDPRQTFERLTQPHLDALYRFAARRIRRSHEAEDAVQEACLKAYRAFEQFEPGTDYRAWLFRILVNTLSDRHRKSARSVPLVSTDDAEPGQTGSRPGGLAAIADPERELMARSEAAAVRRAFEELPGEWQTILHLRLVEGFSYKQIAAILDCPIGTVMSRLYRSRRVLAGRLAAFLGDDAGARRGPAAVTSLARIRERLGRQVRERRDTGRRGTTP